MKAEYIWLWIFKFKQKLLLLNLENVFPSIDISQYHKAITNRGATSLKRENLSFVLDKKEDTIKYRTQPLSPAQLWDGYL